MTSILIILGAAVGIIAIFALAIAYSAFSWGLVLYKFWDWFVLPVFVTLPVLTLIQAVGLMFFISLFKTQPFQVMKNKYEKKNYATYLGLLAPWVSLFIGYLVKVFIVG